MSQIGKDHFGLFRRDHGDTSVDAAFEIKPVTGAHRSLVYGAIVRAGDHGMTDEEIQDELAMNPNTERPRRRELVTGGHIIDSGNRRLTRSKRRAVVWILKA